MLKPIETGSGFPRRGRRLPSWRSYRGKYRPLSHGGQVGASISEMAVTWRNYHGTMGKPNVMPRFPLVTPIRDLQVVKIACRQRFRRSLG